MVGKTQQGPATCHSLRPSVHQPHQCTLVVATGLGLDVCMGAHVRMGW